MQYKKYLNNPLGLTLSTSSLVLYFCSWKAGELSQGEVTHASDPLIKGEAVVLHDVDNAPVLRPHHTWVGLFVGVEEDRFDNILVKERKETATVV